MSSQQVGFNMNNSSGGYRGGRGGGYNSRGGGMNSMPNYNRGGFQQPMTGGFQGAHMGGFQGAPMGGIQPYGGYPTRGGMMGGMRGGAMNMRGGRGGMSPNGMMGMPMGSMGIGGMGTQLGGMGMGMPQMGAAMGMQGMQASHNYPSTNQAGPCPSSANTTRPGYASNQSVWQYRAPVIAAGQYSYLGSPSGYPSDAEGSFGNTPPSLTPDWASLTQYSPLVPSTSSSRFPSQPIVSTAVINHVSPKHNRILNPSTLYAGHTGFHGTQAHYNPAFFPPSQQSQQNVGAGDSTWNPHGAKRTRQE